MHWDNGLATQKIGKADYRLIPIKEIGDGSMSSSVTKRKARMCWRDIVET